MKSAILCMGLIVLAWLMGGCEILLPDKGGEDQTCLGQNKCEVGLSCVNNKCFVNCDNQSDCVDPDVCQCPDGTLVCSQKVCREPTCVTCSPKGAFECGGTLNRQIHECKDDGSGNNCWVGFHDCDTGKHCESTQGCVLDCDSCITEGEERCVSEKHLRCKVDGTKRCWTAEACTFGTHCGSDHVDCQPGCVSECTTNGEKKCDGTTKVLVCKDGNQDTCLEWLQNETCNLPLTCDKGVCSGCTSNPDLCIDDNDCTEDTCVNNNCPHNPRSGASCTVNGKTGTCYANTCYCKLDTSCGPDCLNCQDNSSSVGHVCIIETEGTHCGCSTNANCDSGSFCDPPDQDICLGCSNDFHCGDNCVECVTQASNKVCIERTGGIFSCGCSDNDKCDTSVGETCNLSTHMCEGGCDPVANCTGKVCGPDGCNGTCPPGCDLGDVCDSDGTGCMDFCWAFGDNPSCWWVAPTGMDGLCFDQTTQMGSCPTAGLAYFGQDGNYLDQERIFTNNTASKFDWVVYETIGGEYQPESNKLSWTGSLVGAPDRTWQEAVTYCIGLRTGGFAGDFGEWRLPSVLELASILEHQNNPPISSWFSLDPKIYWTASNSGNTSKAWGVDFGTGNIFFDNRTAQLNHRAICVHGLPWGSDHPQRFLATSDGKVVTDQATTLIWTAQPSGDLSWANPTSGGALEHCQNLDFTSDGTRWENWRLPNINELLSLMNYEIAAGHTNFPLLGGIADLDFWSATTYFPNKDVAWTMNFLTGDKRARLVQDKKIVSTTHRAICVHIP